MYLVGLTGNYGMGKSHVLSVFRELGAVTLDSDRIVEILLKERPVIDRLCDIFGKEIIKTDGQPDKKLVAEKVFKDKELKHKLELLIHPLVFQRVDEFLAGIRDKELLVVVEVPLLFEGEYQGRFKKIITVHTSEETAVKRLTEEGITKDNALARLRNQLPIEVKKAKSDYVIDNSGTKEETAKQVLRIMDELRSVMAATARSASL